MRLVAQMLAQSLDPQVAALHRLVIGEPGARPQLRDPWNADGPNRLAAELADLTDVATLVLPAYGR